MKPNDNIEELFEAAKRHEKDMQRQQRLSVLVDQWSAAETAAEAANETAAGKSHNRKPIWITIGVAASILLMVSIGLRVLQPQPAQNGGTIVAQNNPDTAKETNIIPDNQPLDKDTRISTTTPVYTKPATKQELLSEATPTEETEPSETIDTVVPLSAEKVLLAENESQETETTTVARTEKKVFERTSNRLISSNIRNNTHSSPNRPETPLMAYSGTGTSVVYDLGKIEF